MPVITPNDLTCASGQSDAVIQLVIDSVIEQVGDCLDASYKSATAKMIAISTVCHLLASADGGEISSERAPNGSSTTYANNASGQGLRSTEAGRLALSLDTANCLNAMFADTFVFLSCGDVESPNEF